MLSKPSEHSNSNAAHHALLCSADCCLGLQIPVPFFPFTLQPHAIQIGVRSNQPNHLACSPAMASEAAESSRAREEAAEREAVARVEKAGEGVVGRREAERWARAGWRHLTQGVQC